MCVYIIPRKGKYCRGINFTVEIEQEEEQDEED